MPYHSSSNRGVAMLFAVLLSGLIALMAYGIFSIVRKQAVLVGTTTNAQHAFLAADAGVECALYSDVASGVLPFTDPGGSATYPTLSCAGEVIPTDGNVTHGLTFARYRWIFMTNDGGSPERCAFVEVLKTNNGTTAPGTTVTSRGYSSCIDAGTAYPEPRRGDPSLVERRLEVRYAGVGI